jgi:CRISPR/Cas system-associated protein Cas10 (large subunit of type III CRISPR-Cas system)
MSNDLDFVRTCAILHDIGKPRCWAKEKRWIDHIDYTYDVLKESLGEEFADAAMHHHSGQSYSNEVRPRTDVEKVICLADNLSSGADRREEPVHGTPLPKPPLFLTHVLSRGNVNRTEVDSPTLEYTTLEIIDKLKELKTVFGGNRREGYVKLFELLESSRLQDIPADTRSPINDVSLWDHLKLTAAFATCIWLSSGYKGDALNKYEFALISGDADKISRFVNLSSRLPDLNARSERIRMATDACRACINELLGPECVIFAGGGGLLAISPVNIADNVSEAVKESFEKATQGLATMTVGYLRSFGDKMQRAFSSIWKEAQWQMRLRKSERLPTAVEALSDDVNACDVCHVRAMAHEDSGKMLPYDASPRPERLCEFCWLLRKEGHGVSLDHIKGRSSLAAIIRADGDDIGRILGGERLEDFEKAATPSRLSAISRHVHGVCERTLEKVVRDAHGKCLIAGGDDVLAIVPGEDSLNTALNIAVKFKHEMADESTMSGGVAIFRYDLPVYAGLEAAEALLHLAKETEAKDSVAFAIIGGVGLTVDEMERIKRGPWRWSELELILRLSKKMSESGVASSQIRKIASAAQKDPEFADILIRSLMGRGEKGKGVSWSEGESFRAYLKSGILLDAFAVYNAFKA